jgi:hypothetical protein
LYIIYKFCKDSFQYDILAEVCISKPSLVKIKNILIECIKEDLVNNNYKIGDKGVVLQCDETAISRKKNSLSKSSTENARKTKWPFGVVEENNFYNFRIVLMKD